MRRSILCAPFALLLLCSCGGGGLSASDVLQRAVSATQNLKSVRFEATCDVKTGAKRGTTCAIRGGVMQDQGKQMRFSLDLRKDGSTGSGFSLDVMSGGATETYVRPVSVPGGGDLSALLGSWWKLPTSSGSLESMTVTPDPQLLRLQAEAVTAVKDRGTEILDGHSVYHLDTALDPAKLIAFLQADAAERGAAFDEGGVRQFLAQYDAQGEVWVDAATFAIRRLQWTIVPRGEGGGESWHFDVHLSDHDSAPNILPPSDAKSLSPELYVAGLKALSSFLPQADSEERFLSSGSGITLFLQ